MDDTNYDLDGNLDQTKIYRDVLWNSDFFTSPLQLLSSENESNMQTDGNGVEKKTAPTPRQQHRVVARAPAQRRKVVKKPRNRKRGSVFGPQSGPRPNLHQYMTRQAFEAKKSAAQAKGASKEVKTLEDCFQRQKIRFLNAMAISFTEKTYLRVCSGDKSGEGLLDDFYKTIGFYYENFGDGAAKQAIHQMRQKP